MFLQRFRLHLAKLLLVSLLLTALFSKKVLANSLGKERLAFQGMLTSNQVATFGRAINDTLTMTFLIYDDEVSGSLLWQETLNNVEVKEGIFSVELGKEVPLSAELFNSDRDLWVAIKIDNSPEMLGRYHLLAAPYARSLSNTKTAAEFIDNRNATNPVSVSSTYAAVDPNLALEVKTSGMYLVYFQGMLNDPNPAKNIYMTIYKGGLPLGAEFNVLSSSPNAACLALAYLNAGEVINAYAKTNNGEVMMGARNLYLVRLQ